MKEKIRKIAKYVGLYLKIPHCEILSLSPPLICNFFFKIYKHTTTYEMARPTCVKKQEKKQAAVVDADAVRDSQEHPRCRLVVDEDTVVVHPDHTWSGK